MSTTTTDQGHPGVWPGGEPDEVRDACDRWLAEHPEPPQYATVPAPRRAYRPGKGNR